MFLVIIDLGGKRGGRIPFPLIVAISNTVGICCTLCSSPRDPRRNTACNCGAGWGWGTCQALEKVRVRGLETPVFFSVSSGERLAAFEAIGAISSVT